MYSYSDYLVEQNSFLVDLHFQTKLALKCHQVGLALPVVAGERKNRAFNKATSCDCARCSRNHILQDKTGPLKPKPDLELVKLFTPVRFQK